MSILATPPFCRKSNQMGSWPSPQKPPQSEHQVKTGSPRQHRSCFIPGLLEEGFTPAEIEEGLTIFKPVGCEHCHQGYRGRIGIYQVMPVSDAMGRLIMEGGNAIQLAEQARLEGILDLRQSGLRKVKSGITSLEEVNRVTKE